MNWRVSADIGGTFTDLVAIGRPHLIDPMWTLRAAAAQGYRDVACPQPYLNGLAQLARLFEREQPSRS